MTALTLPQVMQQLENAGTDKVRAMYQRNGAGDNVFGVMMGKIRSLGDAIGKNHALALQLWETGNVEARYVACMTLDPAALNEKQARALLEPLTYVMLLDELVSRVLVHAPCADALRDRWIKSKDELQQRAGWKLLAGQVARGTLATLEPASLLARIERESPAAPHRAREGMNHGLVQIGLSIPELTETAVAIGERLGVWDLRPIPKGCTSSYPPEWIAVVLAKKDATWKPRAEKAIAVRVAALAAGKKTKKQQPALKKETTKPRAKTQTKKAAPRSK